MVCDEARRSQFGLLKGSRVEILSDVNQLHTISNLIVNQYTKNAGQTKAFSTPRTPTQKPVAVEI